MCKGEMWGDLEEDGKLKNNWRSEGKGFKV
jgi:hypothetical protein